MANFTPNMVMLDQTYTGETSGGVHVGTPTKPVETYINDAGEILAWMTEAQSGDREGWYNLDLWQFMSADPNYPITDGASDWTLLS